MYAVIKTGGKQYTVKEGDKLRVENLEGEVGSKIELTDVLAIGEGDNLKIGTPNVENAKVVCQITAHDKAKKIIIVKKKRRKGYARRQGHRQGFTALKVEVISA